MVKHVFEENYPTPGPTSSATNQSTSPMAKSCQPGMLLHQVNLQNFSTHLKLDDWPRNQQELVLFSFCET